MERTIKIIHRGLDAFRVAMDAAFVSQYPRDKEHKCNGYVIKDGRLILSKYADKEIIKFPYEYTKEQTIQFAWGWLESGVQPTGREPDTDGSTKIGFEVSSEGTDWQGIHGTFIGIKPVWLVYGK